MHPPPAVPPVQLLLATWMPEQRARAGVQAQVLQDDEAQPLGQVRADVGEVPFVESTFDEGAHGAPAAAPAKADGAAGGAADGAEGASSAAAEGVGAAGEPLQQAAQAQPLEPQAQRASRSRQAQGLREQAAAEGAAEPSQQPQQEPQPQEQNASEAPAAVADCPLVIDCPAAAEQIAAATECPAECPLSPALAATPAAMPHSPDGSAPTVNDCPADSAPADEAEPTAPHAAAPASAPAHRAPPAKETATEPTVEPAAEPTAATAVEGGVRGPSRRKTLREIDAKLARAQAELKRAKDSLRQARGTERKQQLKASQAQPPAPVQTEAKADAPTRHRQGPRNELADYNKPGGLVQDHGRHESGRPRRQADEHDGLRWQNRAHGTRTIVPPPPPQAPARESGGRASRGKPPAQGPGAGPASPGLAPPVAPLRVSLGYMGGRSIANAVAAAADAGADVADAALEGPAAKRPPGRPKGAKRVEAEALEAAALAEEGGEAAAGGKRKRAACGIVLAKQIAKLTRDSGAAPPPAMRRIGHSGRAAEPADPALPALPPFCADPSQAFHLEFSFWRKLRTPHTSNYERGVDVNLPLVCAHGRRNGQVGSRLVSRAAWEAVLIAFPKASCLPNSDEACGVCETEANEAMRAHHEEEVSVLLQLRTADLMLSEQRREGPYALSIHSLLSASPAGSAQPTDLPEAEAQVGGKRKSVDPALLGYRNTASHRPAKVQRFEPSLPAPALSPRLSLLLPGLASASTPLPNASAPGAEPASPAAQSAVGAPGKGPAVAVEEAVLYALPARWVLAWRTHAAVLAGEIGTTACVKALSELTADAALSPDTAAEGAAGRGEQGGALEAGAKGWRSLGGASGAVDVRELLCAHGLLACPPPGLFLTEPGLAGLAGAPALPAE
ncbi:hypothetical protein T492DRAFT_1145027, partial [Pavlovales sp. CCMP2436]